MGDDYKKRFVSSGAYHVQIGFSGLVRKVENVLTTKTKEYTRVAVGQKLQFTYFMLLTERFEFRTSWRSFMY